MSEYDKCEKSRLKLKIDHGIKKKKKKDKSKKKFLDQIIKSTETEKESEQPREVKLTKAELSFLKHHEKIEEEKIREKASMTHKRRVEEFNRHLDSLTEHFDIPKVSWTK